MRLDAKSAGFFATGAFLLLLIFGIGWPGAGAWLLVLGLLTLLAAVVIWWIDSATLPRAAVIPANGGYSPRSTPFRGGNGSRRSRLLRLGLPGPDANGRWVLPDSVHVTLVAGSIGVLALVIFTGDAVGGGGASTDPAAVAQQPLDPQAIDFDNPVTVESAPDPTAPRDPTAPAPIVTNFDPIDVQTPSNPQPGLARPIDVVNAPREDPNTSFHEVVSGDTIYDLALALGSSVDAIMQANGLSEFDTLHIGQILVVPLIEEDDDEATAAATTSDP